MPMTPDQHELWARIEAFAIDDPTSDFAYSDRLARENGWSKVKTSSVIREYRKFVFLACEAGHTVTPSVDIDEAWHLHMLYTRDYWDELCNGVLNRPLHHGPTRGGAAEASKFHDWYGKTLDSYERLFGARPPADIWPSPEKRFGAESIAVRVRPATHWVVPKPHAMISKLAASARSELPALTARTAAIMGIALLTTLTMVGCSRLMEGQGDGAGFSNPITTFDAKRFLIFYPIVWVAIFTLTTWFQRLLLNEPVQDETVREFERASPETIALMQERLGQRNRLTEMLLARLVAENRIRYDDAKSRYVLGDTDSKPANVFDAEMQKAVASQQQLDTVPKVGDYAARISESLPVRTLTAHIDEKRLFSERSQVRFAKLVAFVAILGFLTIGIARAQVGLQRHRPIGFLILEMMAGGLLGLLWTPGSLLMARYAPGAKILRRLRKNQAVRKPAKTDGISATDDDFWRSFAVVGLAVLPSTDVFSGFVARHQPPMPDSSGCGVDGGGGCGGGAGACGGGGCGGCGGGGCGS